ncbi:MAG: hypothetical protein IPI67_12785 [Myxococcales bacterium]|nr:hypothetical protein [Myxococcales bacterium]
MDRDDLTTERALACELLNELGFDGDRLAKMRLNGPVCPWLNEAEHRALQWVFTNFPERGGPAVSFTHAARRVARHAGAGRPRR